MWRIEAFRVMDHVCIRALYMYADDETGAMKATLQGQALIPHTDAPDGSPDQLAVVASELLNMAYGTQA